jgi:hypothetical protein
VQVTVSSLHPTTAAALVASDETRCPASGMALVSGSHVLSVGLGIGVPVGGPTPTEVSDQYVASALMHVPPDYASSWSRYRVEISAGAQPMSLAAPAPAVRLGFDVDSK